MEASTQIIPEQDRLYRLRMNGRLQPLWAADLATGLAALRIQIVSARGKRVGLEWHAELLLDFSRSSTLPEALDYQKLASTKNSRTFAGKPRVTRFSSNRLPDGMLEVWVYGPDQSGFLAQLLGRMANTMLFLTEFDINTLGDRIEDRFILVGMGNVSPSPETQEALERTLRTLVVS